MSSSYYNNNNGDDAYSQQQHHERDEKTTQIFFLCFSGILVLVLFLSKFLENRKTLRRYLSEPAMTLLVGIFFSFLVRILNESDYEEYQNHYDEENYNAQAQGEELDEEEYMEQYFSSDLPQFFLFFPNQIFFMALLPPILFNSGYQLQKELFYRHFLPIALFSCVGTCIAAFGAGMFLIGMKSIGVMGSFDPTNLELMTFGALIAATDTVSVVGVLQRKRVDPHLFSLVFGESALNDAVAIVLFKTLAEFLTQNHDAIYNNNYEAEDETLGFKIGKYLLDLVVQATVSPILGLLFAGVMSLAFKHTDMREHRILELSLFILPMYIPFIAAEVLELSGMITAFSTGIFLRRYCEPNVSGPTREYAGILFELLSFLAETCIFLELGLSVFGLHKSYYFQFIAWAFVAALLGRALSVYPISIFYNFSLTRPVTIPSCTSQTPMTCGGGGDDMLSPTVSMVSGNGGKTHSPTSSYNLADADGIMMGNVTAGSQDPTMDDAALQSPASTNNYAQASSSSLIVNPNENTNANNDPDHDGGIVIDGRPDSPPMTPVYSNFDEMDASLQSTLSRTSSYIKTQLQSRRETKPSKRDKVIPFKFMHILWFAGLRGAVAYACAREFPDVNGNKNAFIAATMVIVLVTIVFMGGACESVMEALDIRMGIDHDEYMKVWHKQRRLKGRFLHFEYNYLFRLFVRDESVDFMDESCGYAEHVDDNDIVEIAAAGGGGGGSSRRIRQLFMQHKKNGNNENSNNSDGSGSVLTMKRRNDKSLLDDSINDNSLHDTAGSSGRRIRIARLEGDLNEELGYIQSALNTSQGSSSQLRTSLSNVSSFDSGKYDWDEACKL